MHGLVENYHIFNTACPRCDYSNGDPFDGDQCPECDEELVFECEHCGERFEDESDGNADECEVMGKWLEEDAALATIRSFLRKQLFARRLGLFAQHMTEEYLHPDSPYVKAVLENIGTDVKNPRGLNCIIYISSDNQLKTLRVVSATA